MQLNWGHEQDVETWVIEGNGSQIYKVPLHIIVADVSKSLLCSICVPHAYLSNPTTGTWRCLTLLSREGQVPVYLFFHTMAFDVSTRRYIVIVGEHNFDERPGGLIK